MIEIQILVLVTMALLSRVVAELDIDYFHIKWAETREEFGEAFKLVYAVTNAA